MTSQGTSLVAKRPLLAVLYQAIDPPLIDGARKPKKPGGNDYLITNLKRDYRCLPDRSV